MNENPLRQTVSQALEVICLLVLIGVAALRPLIVETYDSALTPFDEAIKELAAPSPIRTLMIDLIILGAACAWLLARAIGGSRRFRWTGIELGTALIALASIVSCIAAGQKRIAINASLDWICLPVAAIVLVQVLRKRWQQRLLLGAILASASVQALQCYEEYNMFDDTWAQYQEDKEEIWTSQGVELDSPRVALFEQRMKSREAAGFFSHSNVAGAFLVLTGLAALGAAIGQWRIAKTPGSVALAVMATALTVAIGGAVILTKSRGAMLSAGAALLIWAASAIGRDWFRRHRRSVLAACWIGLGVGVVAVVAHGLYHDSLPGASLTFRWQYWKATAAMIMDHPWFGVGRENFGGHYLQYKSIAAPEEISNPHNLFMEATAEYGILGLIGLAAMLFGGSIMATHARPQSARQTPNDPQFLRRIATAGFGVFVGVQLFRLLLLGSENPEHIYYTMMTGGMAWLFAFVAFVPAGIEGREGRPPDDSAMNGARAGLFAFLVHDLINFALFVPAAGYAFFSLFALAKSARYAEDETAGEHRNVVVQWMPFGAGAVAFLLIFLLVLPALRANRLIIAGRQDTPGAATDTFQEAAEIDSLDPVPYLEKCRSLWQLAQETGMTTLFLDAVDSLDRAIDRDPKNVSLWRLKVRAARQLASITGQVEQYQLATDAALRAVELYPESPIDWISLGTVRFEAGVALKSIERLEASIAALEHGLALDNERPDWEWLRRLRPGQVAEVNERIAEAKKAIEQIRDSQPHN